MLGPSGFRPSPLESASGSVLSSRPSLRVVLRRRCRFVGRNPVGRSEPDWPVWGSLNGDVGSRFGYDRIFSGDLGFGFVTWGGR